MSNPNPTFPSTRLLTDLAHISTSINAPYSQSVVLKVLETFHTSLSNGAIAIRTTNRPNDPLNFWAGEYTRTDTISQAVNSNLISASHPTILLLRSWFELYDEEPKAEPSTDFDTVKGLVKTWVYFMRLRPIEEILGAEHVPESFRGHIETLKGLGAGMVYHVAVSYQSTSVNLYLQIKNEFTPERAKRVVRTLLPGCGEVREDEIGQMMKCMRRGMPIVFAVTLDYPSGVIERICFYAFRVDRGVVESVGVGERLEVFLRETPCYDKEEVVNLGWSFGRNGDRYLKMDIGYCGGFCDILNKLKHD